MLWEYKHSYFTKVELEGGSTSRQLLEGMLVKNYMYL